MSLNLPVYKNKQYYCGNWRGGNITLFNFAHQWYHSYNENNVLCMNPASNDSTLVRDWENTKQKQSPQAVSEYE